MIKGLAGSAPPSRDAPSSSGGRCDTPKIARASARRSLAPRNVTLGLLRLLSELAFLTQSVSALASYLRPHFLHGVLQDVYAGEVAAARTRYPLPNCVARVSSS